MEGVPNSRKWSRDPLATPVDENFNFFTVGHLAIDLLVKFRISRFNIWRDMEGFPKFPEIVTWPIATRFDLNFHCLR